VTFHAHLDVGGGISGDMALGVKRGNTSPPVAVAISPPEHGDVHEILFWPAR
jgi:hypothetical protein